MLRCTLLFWAGGGAGGGVITSCVYDFFGEHTSCYVANFCFGQGVGRGGAITSCVYVIIDFLRWTHFILPCIRNYTYVLIRWTHFMLRCTRVFQFGERTSCYVAHVCFNSVKTLHFMLRAYVFRWTSEHTSCYVAHVCFDPVNTLHVTLHACVVLWWTRVMLRCTLLLYVGETHFMLRCTLRCTSVDTLHVTLRTSVSLRCEHTSRIFTLRLALLFDFGEHISCFVAHVCFYSVNTLHVMQVEVMEKNRWRCAET